jgi:hypothetical protein
VVTPGCRRVEVLRAAEGGEGIDEDDDRRRRELLDELGIVLFGRRRR